MILRIVPIDAFTVRIAQSLIHASVIHTYLTIFANETFLTLAAIGLIKRDTFRIDRTLVIEARIEQLAPLAREILLTFALEVGGIVWLTETVIEANIRARADIIGQFLLGTHALLFGEDTAAFSLFAAALVRVVELVVAEGVYVVDELVEAHALQAGAV